MQKNLFGEEISQYTLVEKNDKYTRKVDSPIYTPSSNKPHILSLVDKTKTSILISQIESSNVSHEEKKFLIEAAHRHSVFNYARIADYYSHATKEMQELMEKSALVIIDFNKSIEYGFTKLDKKMEELYKEETLELKQKKQQEDGTK